MPLTDSGATLVLGGDGYIGWPLSLALARAHPRRRVVLVDSLLRRRLVAEVGGRSALPLRSMSDRIAAARSVLGLDNLSAVEAEVDSDDLEHLLDAHRPTRVVHLAHQASAPYAMRGFREAELTWQTNERGTLRLLWALRGRDVHLVAMGSFGAYAKSNLPIAEGRFRPSWRGVVADEDLPYPRRSDDLYHLTKANIGGLFDLAAAQWGQSVTELMQATVVGAATRETRAAPALSTRLDIDPVFGTVLHRFAAMAVLELPLTVYGTGHQRTGLMPLSAAVDSMVALVDDRRPGHRVVNHLSEHDFSVVELAELVAERARARGLDTRVQTGTVDPRGERRATKRAFSIDSSIPRPSEPFGRVVDQLFDELLPVRHGLDPDLLAPHAPW